MRKFNLIIIGFILHISTSAFAQLDKGDKIECHSEPECANVERIVVTAARENSNLVILSNTLKDANSTTNILDLVIGSDGLVTGYAQVIHNGMKVEYLYNGGTEYFYADDMLLRVNQQSPKSSGTAPEQFNEY